MDYQGVKDKLIEQFKENNIIENADYESILNKDLINSGLIDSMAMMKAQAIIEDEFGVEIPEEKLLGDLRTLDDMIKYLATESN